MGLHFKIDENLPQETVHLLATAGHDATSVIKEQLTGASDARIITVCRREKRVLVTLDTDFADIRTYPPDKFYGIIVLRLNRQDKAHVLQVFQHTINLLSTEPVQRHLWVIEEDKIRIRA